MDDLKARKTVLRAVKNLKKLTDAFISGKSKKRRLLEDVNEQAVFLQVTLKKIPPLENVKIIKVPLPFSLLEDTTEVCLLTGDLDKRNRKAEVEPDILHYKDLLKEHDISQITEVMTLRQLRREYKSYEAKRQLVASYDVFLADSPIVGVLHRFLGKFFYKKRKLPIQIEMKVPNLKDHVNRALSSAVFLLTSHGNSFSSEVAHLKMEDKEITENILAVIKTLAKNIPGEWENIMGMYIKTAKSNSIPIYMSFGNPNDVHLKMSKQKEIVEAEELSTLPNVKVKVFESGKIRFEQEKGNSSGDEYTDEIQKFKKRKFKKVRLNDSVSSKRKRMKKGTRNSFENISDSSKTKHLSKSEENAESNVLPKETPVKKEEVVENDSVSLKRKRIKKGIKNSFETVTDSSKTKYLSESEKNAESNVLPKKTPVKKEEVVENDSVSLKRERVKKGTRNSFETISDSSKTKCLSESEENAESNVLPKETPVKKEEVVENDSVSLKRKRIKKGIKNSFETVTDSSKTKYLSESEKNAESNVLPKKTPVKKEEVVENDSVSLKTRNSFETIIDSSKTKYLSKSEENTELNVLPKQTPVKKEKAVDNESIVYNNFSTVNNVSENNNPNNDISIMSKKVKEQRKSKVNKKN